MKYLFVLLLFFSAIVEAKEKWAIEKPAVVAMVWAENKAEALAGLENGIIAFLKFEGCEEEEKEEVITYVNKQLVKFDYYCDESDFLYFEASTKKGQDFLIREFTRSDLVKVKLNSEDFEFSADGFKATLEKLKKQADSVI